MEDKDKEHKLKVSNTKDLTLKVLLGTINVFFFLVTVLDYSVISLAALFWNFVASLGMSLHLFYVAIDEEQPSIHVLNTDSPTEQDAKREQDNTSEFVDHSFTMPVFLAVYETGIRALSWLNDLVTIKDPLKTLAFCASLPALWFVTWLLSLPDSFCLSLTLNLLLGWPLIKKKIDENKAISTKLARFELKLRSIALKVPYFNLFVTNAELRKKV